MQIKCPYCGYVFYQKCSSGICICPNCITMIEPSEKMRSEEEIRAKLEFLERAMRKYSGAIIIEACLDCEEVERFEEGGFGSEHDEHKILTECHDCEEIETWIEALKWVLGEEKK